MINTKIFPLIAIAVIAVNSTIAVHMNDLTGYPATLKVVNNLDQAVEIEYHPNTDTLHEDRIETITIHLEPEQERTLFTDARFWNMQYKYMDALYTIVGSKGEFKAGSVKNGRRRILNGNLNGKRMSESPNTVYEILLMDDKTINLDVIDEDQSTDSESDR